MYTYRVTELIDWVIVLVAGSSLIFALLAYRSVMKTTSRIGSVLDNFPRSLLTPTSLGKTIRAAYPPEDVAGMINAIVEEQKPSVMRFIAEEGIPFLAAAGSKEVAANAREGKSELAKAVGQLGSGAAGLQGLVASLVKPAKSSGLGEIMQYLPMLQMLNTEPSQPDNGAPMQLQSRSEGDIPRLGPPV